MAFPAAQLLHHVQGHDHRKCLVYLTLSGEDPGIQVPVDFARLSHSIHIAESLRNTLEQLGETAPPALREPLLQYCEILDDHDA
jgi:hypothetical protein